MRMILDARHRYLRAAAWATGRAVKVARWACRSLWHAWTIYGGPNLIMNTMASMVAVCCFVLVWWALEPIVPMQRVAIRSVAPSNGIVDRAQGTVLVVRREICMASGAWGTVRRSFVEAGATGVEYKTTPNTAIFLPGGCHEQVRPVQIPDSLPPGRYTYRASVEFCNRLRCENAWVDDVPFVLTGPWPMATIP